ncbi:MAG: reverse transcriptase family protein [Desulfomonilaceae bacterium]
MRWSTYEWRFRQAARQKGFSKLYVKQCLCYAKPLHEKNLPIIYDQQHLALLVGYSLDFLLRASNGADRFYRSFSVRKFSGGWRKISEPLPSLKEIQRWILDNILYRSKPSAFAKAFVPLSSIRHNARFHRAQDSLLSLDVKDFFPSIKSPRVYGVFRRMGYCREVAAMLAHLCTLDDSLPQGAPTSPALSNLIAVRLDRRLGGYAKKNGFRYTRYADDIAFSGSNLNAGEVIQFVKTVLQDEGMVLNENKTRLMAPHQRQEVTGIVVNTKKMQAPRETRRRLRQIIYYIEKYGIDSHMGFLKKERANYEKHVLGIANFILFVNPRDRDARKAVELLFPMVRLPESSQEESRETSGTPPE